MKPIPSSLAWSKLERPLHGWRYPPTRAHALDQLWVRLNGKLLDQIDDHLYRQLEEDAKS